MIPIRPRSQLASPGGGDVLVPDADRHDDRLATSYPMNRLLIARGVKSAGVL